MASRNNKSPANVPTQVLIKEGAAHLRNKRYRSAIEVYKVLLQRENKILWRHNLANAYRGRVTELAGKGLYKEAIISLNNMELFCKITKNPELYILLLLAAEHYGNTFEYIFSSRDLDPDFLNQVEILLASMILNAEDKVLATVPGDHHLIQLRRIVLDSIKSLSKGDDDRCLTALEKISLRSSYKDYRLFIKGLFYFYHSDMQKALGCFDKIPASSIIKTLANTAVEISSGNFTATAPKKFNLQSTPENEFVVAMTGTKIAPAVLNKICFTAFTTGALKDFFKLIKINKDAFDIAKLTQVCRNLLVTDIACISEFKSIIGPLGLFDITRINAIFYEKMEDLLRANEEWSRCLKLLIYSPFKSSSEQNLARALLLKRIAANKIKILNKKGFGEYDFDDEDEDDWDEDDWDEYDLDDEERWDEDDEILNASWTENLEQSLEYDPTDREIYEKLLNYYKINNLEKFRYWLNILLANFPNDMNALLDAAELACERKAYKKALGYLDQILTMDPINKSAINFKVYVHITKARKHLTERKYHLARQEFKGAAAMEDNAASDGSVLIKWGLFELLVGNNNEGESLVQKGISLYGDGVGAALLVCIEARRIKLQNAVVQPYEQILRKKLAGQVTAENVLDLVKTILPYRDLAYQDKIKYQNYVVSYLKKATKCKYEEAALLTICQFLAQKMEYKLLKQYASIGRQQYNDKPIFVYYFVFSNCSGSPFLLSYRDNTLLKNAARSAEKTGDSKTAQLIRSFLNLVLNPYYRKFPGNNASLDEIILNALDELGPDFVSDLLNNIMGGKFPRLSGLNDDDFDDDDFDK